jgi:pilus assembly protein CpaF
MVSSEGPVLSTVERSRLIRRVIDEAIGLGVLEPLLADPTVTEIMVNGPTRSSSSATAGSSASR